MAYATISKPGLYFNTKLYTGTGSSNAITGVGFQPDFTWIKDRDATNNHSLYDAVRGVTKVILSNATNAETTYAQGLTAFGTDGFTVGTDSQNNTNGNDICSWNWKAGTGQGSSNTDGSINTTYTSVNTTAGFSISSYTGTGSNATVGHGLGAAPEMVIVKCLNDAQNWFVYHQGMGATKVMYLDLTNAAQTLAQGWNNTAPTNSVFSVGTEAGTNQNGNLYVAYCFAEKKGYSKFGTYVGNGNADGTFVYTGFKPALIIGKSHTHAGNWFMWDNKRPNEFNLVNSFLEADNTAVEYTNNSNHSIDIYSNGWKFRGASGSNTANRTAIYMAFAEEPLVANVGASGVPATAR